MRMTKPLAFGMVVAIAACTFAGSASRASVLFDESFDDADLTKRNWYDELAVGTNRIGPLGAGKGTAKEKGQNMEGTWICLSATIGGRLKITCIGDQWSARGERV